MKCNHLISVVDMVDVDLLAAKTARLIEPVAAQANQVAIKSIDTRVFVKLRPIQGGRIAEVFVLKKFLALEDHWDAGGGKDERGTQCRTLPREPTSGIAGPNFFRHPGVTVCHFVMRFRVNH